VNQTHCIKFGCCSVRPVCQFGSFGFGLSNSLGSFGSVRLTKDMGSSSVEFCSLPISSSVQCSRWLSLGSVWGEGGGFVGSNPGVARSDGQ